MKPQKFVGKGPADYATGQIWVERERDPVSFATVYGVRREQHKGQVVIVRMTVYVNDNGLLSICTFTPEEFRDKWIYLLFGPANR